MSDNNDKTNEKSFLLDHNYDGIQEFDYPLPRWWRWLFYLTIIFSLIYAPYYMLGGGPSLKDELKVALAEIEAKKPKLQNTTAGDGDTKIIAALQDPAAANRGRNVFGEKCAACHGAAAEGSIGPNLTDDFWIHGSGSALDIAKTIREGVADKGMPPWGAIVTDDELASLVAFIRSVHGIQPANAKAPQGDKYEIKEL